MNWAKCYLLLMMLAGIISANVTGSLYGQDSTEVKGLERREKLGVGDHTIHLVVDKLKRSAIVHVPANYNPEKPTPVVLALHGAVMTGRAMVYFCGLNETSDEKGFIVVYPDGTGFGPVLTWNAGGFSEEIASRVDDVAFLGKLLDDISDVCNVDTKRIYACGMSNGGMMCYRLAAELSNRIAAIAPVGGTMPNRDAHPQRPVSVIHFHGTLDTLVPYDIGHGRQPRFLRLKSVEQSIQTWCQLDGCDEKSLKTDVLSTEGDEMKVIRQTYGPGTDGAQVVLVTVEGGGHTWPGQVPPVEFIGKAAMNISANQLLWEFFEKHPMK